MNDPMLPLPGLSPVSGKSVVAQFDGGLLSSDGGVLALREAEKRTLTQGLHVLVLSDPAHVLTCDSLSIVELSSIFMK